MPYDSLLIEVGEDFVATTTLNRLKQPNTFNSAMANELHAAPLEPDADPRVRVVVIKGEGKARPSAPASTSRRCRANRPWR
ncbi:hypothetical protein DFAR_4000013 [Desulfarculales bacterium]